MKKTGIATGDIKTITAFEFVPVVMETLFSLGYTDEFFDTLSSPGFYSGKKSMCTDGKYFTYIDLESAKFFIPIDIEITGILEQHEKKPQCIQCFFCCCIGLL